MVNSNVKKSEKEIANEKSKRIMDGIGYWASFYRHNPQRFAKDYLGVNLKLFQKFLLYAMMHYVHFLFWACRSLGKTWLTALFCVVRCILFPQTKICVASATRSQGNEVLSKIEDDFMKNYGQGSVNLCREIEYCNIGQNKAVIKFKNGSWIKVVTATDNGRGSRANVIVVDEFRMVDLNIIKTVIKRFLGAPRQPGYLSLPEYKNREDLIETNIEIYMSSAWYRSHWSYEKSKAYTANMLVGREGYFVCGLPYQIAIKEKLKKRIEIEDEMSESDFDQITFDMEMGCLPYGDTEGSFFDFDDIANRRKLKTAIYPLNINVSNKKNLKIPDLAPNERRILSIDIALMASKKHNNDASSIIINSAMPTNNKEYTANIIYLENHEDLTTDDLTLIVRRLFTMYKCTDLVVDCQGQGLGVYDGLIKNIIDPETGEFYPALNCRNDKIMQERCKVDNAQKVIWAIKASAAFNNEICILLRSGFQNNKINLLVNEFEAKEILKDNIKGYSKLIPEEQFIYESPYTHTTLLVHELTNLEYEVNGNNIKVKEKSGMRKDRYSSLAYNYWVQHQLEINELHKQDNTFDIKKYATAIGKLQKKPRSY